MSGIAKFFSAMLCSAIVLVGANGYSLAAAAPDLTALREAFVLSNKTLTNDSQRQAGIDKYLADLVSLEFDLRSSRRPRAEVNAVRHEIRRVKKDRYAPPVVTADFSTATSVARKPAAQPVKSTVAKEVTPQPAPTKAVIKPVVAPVASAPPVTKPQPVHIPKTKTSEVRGLAGAAKFSKNNIYSFTFKEVGPVSTLVFWASGRRSTDSYGKVWVTTPDKRRVEVAKWKKKNFSVPAGDVNSYKKLRPIRVDVSSLLTGPGTYKVEFSWQDGVDPLVIFRVEITT